MPSAYIETTIPSYYVARSSMNVIQASRQASTRAWWDGGRSGFDLFASQAVLQEARLGDPVISEVRRAKTAVAQQYGFDVIAMVRALRQIDEEEDANKAAVDNRLPAPSPNAPLDYNP